MSRTATNQEVLEWLKDGVFQIREHQFIWKVFKGEKELARRKNKRRGSERGDDRVDLCHKGKRRSMLVSHIVWMITRGTTIPEGFEIHHKDKDPQHNHPDNLQCLHSHDHLLVHKEVHF